MIPYLEQSGRILIFGKFSGSMWKRWVFQFAFANDIFKVGDVGDEAADFGRVVGGLLEVGADAVAQVDGLADVDDRAVFVLVEITAGFGGQGREFFFDGGRCHTLMIRQTERFCKFRRVFQPNAPPNARTTCPLNGLTFASSIPPL